MTIKRKKQNKNVTTIKITLVSQKLAHSVNCATPMPLSHTHICLIDRIIFHDQPLPGRHSNAVRRNEKT